MDGNNKEEFCTMCSVEVPTAFKNEDDDIDGVIIIEKKKNCSNMFKLISKWFLKIFLILIIFIFVYFLFKKPDLKK